MQTKEQIIIVNSKTARRAHSSDCVSAYVFYRIAIQSRLVVVQKQLLPVDENRFRVNLAMLRMQTVERARNETRQNRTLADRRIAGQHLQTTNDKIE